MLMSEEVYELRYNYKSGEYWRDRHKFVGAGERALTLFLRQARTYSRGWCIVRRSDNVMLVLSRLAA